MTTDPERAANTSGTESVEDEDDNHRKILRRTDVLAALRDGITAPGLEVLQYYFPSSFGKLYIHRYIHVSLDLYKFILLNARVTLQWYCKNLFLNRMLPLMLICFYVSFNRRILTE